MGRVSGLEAQRGEPGLEQQCCPRIHLLSAPATQAGRPMPHGARRFGFPQFPSTMLGADAIIVKQCAACPSGASVDGYSLVGYSPADNVAGSFNIAGERAAGRLARLAQGQRTARCAAPSAHHRARPAAARSLPSAWWGACLLRRRICCQGDRWHPGGCLHS